MKTPRLAEEDMAWWKYWQPPQPPTESTILVPLPLFLAAVTSRLRVLAALPSKDRPLDELGRANAGNECQYEN
jgi:hypothetical protein